MDFYDKTRSKLGNSVATPETGLAHATGLEEHPTCDSDIYLGYEQAPTREIINAIEGAGLTRDATNLSQLLAAINALIDTKLQAGLSIPVPAQGTGILAGAYGASSALGTITLTLPANRKWTFVEVYTTQLITSTGTFAFKKLESNTVAQSVVTNMVVDFIYGNQNSDDHQTHYGAFKFVPTAQSSNQSIKPFFSDNPNGGAQVGGRSLYGVGYHEPD